MPGARVYGVASAGRTLSQMPVVVPVNLVEGAHAGPVLAVTCAVHGAELIGTFALLDVIRNLDFSRLRGLLIAVPVTYMWYTIAKGPPDNAIARRALEMATAFGLTDIAIETPWKDAGFDLGIPAITPEVGGGPDFLRSGQTQVETCARGIRNVMRLLGMIDGSIEDTPGRYRLWRIHSDITNGAVGGILSMRVRRGDHLEAGQIFGVVRHPFNGEECAWIVSPARGTVVDSRVVWPVVRPGQWLAALGDVVDEVAAGW